MLKRFLIIASGLAFLGLMTFPLAGLFSSSSQQASQPKPGLDPSQQKKLEQEEKGYEQVLQREPKNQIAIQGLAKTRLQLQDWQGAIEPLEKLAVLYPNEVGIFQALAQVKIRTGDVDGAIAATEKLVKLDPERQEYKNFLKLLKEQASGPVPTPKQ